MMGIPPAGSGVVSLGDEVRRARSNVFWEWNRNAVTGKEWSTCLPCPALQENQCEPVFECVFCRAFDIEFSEFPHDDVHLNADTWSVIFGYSTVVRGYRRLTKSIEIT